MTKTTINQGLNLNISHEFAQDTHLLTWIDAFLVDRKAQNMSKGTLYFYQKKIKLFIDYCEAQAITQITQITPNDIRQWLLYLESKGHNPGGIHCAYRALRTFLYWWEQETEPEDWKNPIRRVKPPKLPTEPLEPVSLDSVQAMVKTCKPGTFYGDRDKAMLLALLDTGARATEFININLTDYNQVTGEILIRQGKGRKPRTVYLGKQSRKAVRSYLRHRDQANEALWVTAEGERLTYSGLRQIDRRRAGKVGIPEPGLHNFRRAFCLNMLRAGVDIVSISRLMGHADIQVLQRYLKQTTDDLAEAHRRGSPVNHSGL